MHLIFLSAIAISIALTGCTSPATEESSELAAQERIKKQHLPLPDKGQEPKTKEPEISYDEFTGKTTVSWKVEDFDMLEGKRPWPPTIYGILNSRAENFIAIALLFTMDDWAFYNAAYAAGKEYKLLHGDRQVRGNARGVSESVTIVIERSEFQSLKDNGFKVRVDGKRASSAFFIPPENFVSFFKVFDEQLS